MTSVDGMIRFHWTDHLKLILGTMVAMMSIVAAVWAFGGGVFGRLHDIERNTEINAAQEAQLVRVAQLLEGVVRQSEQVSRDQREHETDRNIHQTRGEKLADREIWWDRKWETIHDYVMQEFSHHEQLPHEGSIKRDDATDAVLNRVMERLRASETRDAVQDTKLNILGNLHGKSDDRSGG